MFILRIWNGADQVRFLEAQNQVLLSMSTRVGVRIKVLILRSPESYIFFFFLILSSDLKAHWPKMNPEFKFFVDFIIIHKMFEYGQTLQYKFLFGQQKLPMDTYKVYRSFNVDDKSQRFLLCLRLLSASLLPHKGSMLTHTACRLTRASRRTSP